MPRKPALLTSQIAHGAVFDIYVDDGFVLTEFASIVDILRIANRIGARSLFSWNCVSGSGGNKQSSSGAVIETAPYSRGAKADYLFALGNRDVAHIDPGLGHAISQYRHRGAKVFLLAEAASWFMRQSGDQAGVHTTHWENRLVLSETLDASDWGAQLARQSGDIVTCAGMGSTIDVMLALLAEHLPLASVRTIADIMLHDKIRDLATVQPFGGQLMGTTGDAGLDRSVALMQDNIEEPLPIAEIGRLAGLSARSLERKFKARLNATPNGYYRMLRLTKASSLIHNTTMSIREIGMACGFSSGFASLYKALFGISPSMSRRMRAQSNTSISGNLNTW